MSDIPLLLQRNTARWQAASFKPAALATARKVAARLTAPKAKAVYQKIEELTGVPWFAVAMIHEREASQRWDRSIAQGDPWNARSLHVPKGRGPFRSFIEAAVDALVKCPPYAARWKDWTPGGMLTLQEMYNGLGYANKGRPSAYIWSGSDQYISGKYVADGVYDPKAVDSQLGCAVMLKAMMEADPSIYPPDAVAHEDAGSDSDELDPADYPDAPEPAPTPAAAPVAALDPPPAELPKPMTQSKIGVTQIAAGGGAAVAAAGQAANSFGDKATSAVEQVTTLKDKAGAVVSTTKQVIDLPKPGFWHGVQAFITSPGFLAALFAAIALAAGLTFYFRWRDHGRGQTLS